MYGIAHLLPIQTLLLATTSQTSRGGDARKFPALPQVGGGDFPYPFPTSLVLSGLLNSYIALAKIKRHVLVGLISAMSLLRKRSRNGAARKESTAAVAHDGRVTGILPTPDGLHWLTAGTDNRLRLWDARHNYHLLVNYPQTFNSSMKVSRAVTHTSKHVHPNIDQNAHVAVAVCSKQRGGSSALVFGERTEL